MSNYKEIQMRQKVDILGHNYEIKSWPFINMIIETTTNVDKKLYDIKDQNYDILSHTVIMR